VVLLPGTSPVTVAGAARDFHPLPNDPALAILAKSRVKPDEVKERRNQGI